MTEYRHLFELISDNFDYNDLTFLCKSLGVDIEELPGGFGKKRKAMELQEYMRRRGRSNDLLEEVHRARPHLDLRPFGGLGPEEMESVPIKTVTSSVPSEPQVTKLVTKLPAAAKDYENFDIHIGMHHADGRYPLKASSLVAGDTGTILQTLPRDDEAFTDVVYYLRELMAGSHHAEQLGRKLRDFLFPQDIWNLYNRSLAVVKERGKNGLRVRLRFSLESSPELGQIPWEYCEGDRTYLALDETTPMVRYIDTDRPPIPVAVPGTVRILVVVASPKDQDPLDVAAEEQRIRQTLASLEQRGQIEVKVIPHATRLKLLEHVNRFDPHILHFIGHGLLNSAGEGTLVLESETGHTDAIDAKWMLVLLQNRSVRVVILNACETAAAEESRAFMGVAPRLVWAGIPAVIAMQFAIPDPVAVAFMQFLYEALAEGKPLDMAMTAARKGAYLINNEIFWAIPVLFMRAPDGVIWQPQ